MIKALLILGLQLIAIPLVILVFKLPYEKKYLSLLATTIFFACAGAGLFYWYRFGKTKVSLLLHAAFLMMFALPIIGLRLFYWDLDFNDPSVSFILSAATYHKYSSTAYMALLASSIYEVIKLRLTLKK